MGRRRGPGNLFFADDANNGANNNNNCDDNGCAQFISRMESRLAAAGSPDASPQVHRSAAAAVELSANGKSSRNSTAMIPATGMCLVAAAAQPGSGHVRLSRNDITKGRPLHRSGGGGELASDAPPARKSAGRHQLPHQNRRLPDRGWALGTMLAPADVSPVITVGLLLLFALAQAHVTESFFIDEKQSPSTSEWSYADQMRWRLINHDCSGRAQSPIDIMHNNVITSQNLRLHFFNYDQQIRFRLSNAHHTVKMNPTGPAYDQDSEPRVDQRSLLNTSSIRDIMSVDDYVEFTPSASKRPAGAAAQPVGGSDGDHMSKLLGGTQRPHTIGRLADPQRDARGRSRAGQQPAPIDNMEHERELNHGQASAGFGGLFGFPASKEPFLYDGAPTIKLDWLDEGNNEYKLRDIHFHWGKRRDNGSEHAIDGQHAAMEMHLVHIKHGLDKSNIGFTSDSVAVVSILIESHRKSNLVFNPIVNELARINSSEVAQEVGYESLYDLLPTNLQAFYTYSGSLTTPPCYQVVNWIVMAERIHMHSKQIEMFRNLYAPSKHHREEPAAVLDDTNGASSHDGYGPAHNEPASGSELIMPNVRALQKLYNRTIMASFTKHGSRLESVTSPMSSASSVLIDPLSYLQMALIALVFQISQMRRLQQHQLAP